MATLCKEKQQQWKRIIESQKESGLTIEQWCLKNKIGVSCFYKWKAKLFSKRTHSSSKGSFVELKAINKWQLFLSYQGVNIQLESPTLKQILPILEKLQPFPLELDQS